MDDKEWSEFWDNDEQDEDDDYNDVGSDIDANNDETFDNAAEWNEDEHEELIARDSILSHTIRNNNHTSNNRNHIQNRVNCNNNNVTNNNNISINNNASESVHPYSSIVGAASRGGCYSISDKDPLPNRNHRDNCINQPTGSNSAWDSRQDGFRPLQFQQQQQQIIFHSRLEEEAQQLQQQQRERERERQRQILQRQSDHQASVQPPVQASLQTSEVCRRILRVDELERQLLRTRINRDSQPETNATSEPPKRTGWSPFGGSDLFKTPETPAPSQPETDSHNIMMHANLAQVLTPEQRQQIMLQQHQILKHQQQIQQMATLKQQQMQQEQRLMSHNPQCFTVEELERQMVANRSEKLRDTSYVHQNDSTRESIVKSIKPNDRHDNQNSFYDRRDGERNDRNRFDRYNRERDNRDTRNHRDRRERRDGREHRYPNRQKSIAIIPPQVQLNVIDKAKRLLSNKSMQLDEFLQDRMPTSNEGFLSKRHSTVKNEKVHHDGVLTLKERNWLTQIQEKIQADYDDNMDQDYYYLLYFNRSSTADRANKKSSGSGVSDRRFIPRERLLYNSNT